MGYLLCLLGEFAIVLLEPQAHVPSYPQRRLSRATTVAVRAAWLWQQLVSRFIRASFALLTSDYCKVTVSHKTGLWFNDHLITFLSFDQQILNIIL